jgi:two-component system LytT family sensor kinase
VRWFTLVESNPDSSPDPQRVVVPTAEAPQYVVELGALHGGRRLFSDDVVTLERMALLAARRVDAVRLQDERYQRMLREREISALATEAELRALRAQMNPHFLFNALTTVGYLIQSAPVRALDTLLRLTTLLRASLRSEGEFTTLGHERDLVECYLQIEHERFEERLEAHIDVAPSLASLTIPSLIIQPLVENAIKHGIAPSRNGGRVTVAARRDWEAAGAPLRITVTNTGVPLHGRRPRPEEGIGLGNVERRLHAYFGDAAHVTLTSGPAGETIAELVVPVTRASSVDAGSPAPELTWRV